MGNFFLSQWWLRAPVGRSTQRARANALRWASGSWLMYVQHVLERGWLSAALGWWPGPSAVLMKRVYHVRLVIEVQNPLKNIREKNRN